MIAKRVDSPKKTSSIKRLVDYINNPAKQGGEYNRLATYMDRHDAGVRITNCSFNSLQAAVKEIEAVQKKNTRSKNDKTYHLVISFREGEEPDQDILAQIEDRFADSIGLGEHQQISALHTDTNNWHLHVALNKVHPVSFCNVEPYFDKFKMSETCRELEREFGLLPDNGIQPIRKLSMSRAVDKEAHSGIQSLLTWIRKNAAPALHDTLHQDKVSWAQFQKTMNRYGLIVRPRGAGFVVQDLHTGITVKASGVDRGFSKKNLEEKLGKYSEPEGIHTAKYQYKHGPVQSPSTEQDELWEKYQQQRDATGKARRELLGTLRNQRRAYMHRLFADIRQRKQETYSSSILNWRQKKRIYAALQVERLQALEKGRLSYTHQRSNVNKQHPGMTWTSFLQIEAENGNGTALKILREGKGRSLHAHANHIVCDGLEKAIYDRLHYTVDKRGRIKYRIGKGWILDAGRQVQPGSSDREVLIASLQIAVGKYGKKLEVHGDQEFMDQVVSIAKNMRLGVSINGQRIRGSKAQGKGQGRWR